MTETSLSSRVRTIIRRYGIVLFVTFIVIGGLIAFMAGWRMTPSGPVLVGSLVVTDLPDKTFVYVDEASRIAAADGVAHLDLVPGHHSIIVASEGMQPWNEIVTLESGVELRVRPILVNDTPTKKILEGTERSEAASLMLRLPLPTKEEPLKLEGSCVYVYVNGRNIVADAAPDCYVPYLCDSGSCETTIVATATDDLHAVMALPGYDNALAIAAGNLLYALEIDPRTPRFYAPLFRGTALRAAPWSVGTLVASDGQKAYVITP